MRPDKSSLQNKLFKYLFVVMLGSSLQSLSVQAAKYFNYISYPCADWGPDLEAKEPDKADEVIYFIKKIDFGGEASPKERIAAPTGPSERVWFCRMNWDGSNKKEICELWAGQNPAIANEGTAMWLSVCPKAKKATFSVEYGNGTCLGLWVIDLDGKNLRRIIQPKWTEKDKRAYVHPSMSPDGEEVVFSAVQHEPSVRPPLQSRLGIAKVKTGEVRWLTDGPKDDHPSWSSRGDWIVFTHYKQYTSTIADSKIWLIRPDGSESKPVMGGYDVIKKRLDDKRELFAWWPSWSTDGKWIYALTGGSGFYIIDATKDMAVIDKWARLNGKDIRVGTAKLGRKGILNSGSAIWLVVVQSPDFEVTQVIDRAQTAKVPVANFGDLSWYDGKWGESLK